MAKNIIIVVLTIALLFSGYYGYAQAAEQTRLGIEVETQYQRDFHELVWSIDTINSQLAQLLVTSSSEQTLLSLSSLWRQVYSAVNSLSGLPLGMAELENTDKLLNDIAQYSYYLLKKTLLRDESLSEKDWTQLEEFYDRSQVVKQELYAVEAKVLNDDLRFADVVAYLEDTDQAKGENIIVSAFESIEQQVEAFPEVKFENGVRKIEPKPRPIEGKQISEEQALTIATDFFQKYFGKEQKAAIEFVSEGNIIPTYGVTMTGDGKGESTYVEVSQKGGLVLQMYVPRDIGAESYTLDEAIVEGDSFLSAQGFPEMALVEALTDSGVADLTYVPTIDGILIYSDMVKMQVAMDKNEVVAFDQTSYVAYHRERKIPEAKVTKEEVLADINPHFEVSEVRMAMIPSDYSDTELLTYEIRGKIKDEEFAVFVNAISSEDAKIVRLTKPQQFEINTAEDE